ncbi:hypothetical protein ANCDUO_00779 [Ancylostoma duodenale]|uniref:Uncharacterized protein n=1 Tax=Ancylostoma duodenale TaxID=51022 RepID=A0A0C2HB73_9BILA|nr:hypothetical protein ANCDUO_00779 [Ancylostoma duodenale]
MATGYALYNQPCTISSVYIRFLLLLLNAHINVEVCGYIQVVKYLYKYVHKGPDRASVRLLQENVSGQLDEILAYFDARYVCAPGTIHIFILSVRYIFGQPGTGNTAAANRDITSTAWFKLNLKHEQKERDGVDLQGMVDPRTLQYYQQTPKFFTFVQQTRKWKIREQGTRQIGRMYTATPTDQE